MLASSAKTLTPFLTPSRPSRNGIIDRECRISLSLSFFPLFNHLLSDLDTAQKAVDVANASHFFLFSLFLLFLFSLSAWLQKF